MSNDNPVSTYDVGYKKPPAATRFKPGQSGNRKGRPKSARNASTILDGILNERIVVTEGGKRKSITKREAMLKQLANKALNGDLKSFSVIQKMDRDLEEKRMAEKPAAISIREADAEVLQHFAERLKGHDKTQPSDTKTSTAAEPIEAEQQQKATTPQN